MFTASTIQTITSGARTLLLAGTLTLATFLPAASAVYADGGSTETPIPASAPVLPASQAFDVAPGIDLENVPAVVVATTDGAALLEQPASDSPVIEMLPDGTALTLRIDTEDTVTTDSGENRWWPVAVGGSNGWVNGRSLMSPEDYAAYSATDGTSGAESASSTRVPFDYTGELDGATAQVDADGQGLVMRAEPDASSAEVASISEGSIIQLRIADVDTVYDSAGTRWWPVSYEGADGWVSGFYLITPGSEPQSGSAPTSSEAAPAPDGEYAYAPGNWAVVRTADSGRTNLFTSASASDSVAGTVPHMALVEIISQAPDGWYEVKWDTVQGFISGDLLTAGTAPRTANSSTTPTPAPVSTATAEAVETEPMAAGDIAVVNSESDAGVNARESASSDAERIGYIADEARVDVLAGPETDAQGNEWYQVSDGEIEGWVRADLLEQVASTSTETTVNADTSNASSAGFILPLSSYRFTQDYGCSNLGFYSYDPNWGCAVHDGVDMAAPQGTPLLAVADGTVVVNSWNDGGLGYYVEIDHGNGVHSIYGHMASPSPIAVGQSVTRGEQIGQVGSTGLSTGPHVHFMIRKDGVTQDPKNYLPSIQTSN